MEESRWLAAISCEFDDYIIVEACLSNTEDSLIAVIYETYRQQYGEMEEWSISVMPCNDADAFCSAIIPLPEITKEQRERIRSLFLKKLQTRHPESPWLEQEGSCE